MVVVHGKVAMVRAVLVAMMVGAALLELSRFVGSPAIGMCLGVEPICIGARARCICDGMQNCHWECVR